MSIYMWREATETRENINETITSGISNTQYYYGICFTPSQNCSLIAVKFLINTGANNLSSYIRIAQGDYAAMPGTEYTISNSDVVDGVYTLPTPFSLAANTNYVVSLRQWNASNFGTCNTITYPIVGNILTFKYGTNSNANSPYNQGYMFSALKILV